MLSLSILALFAGATVAKSPPLERLEVVDTPIHEIQGEGLASPLVGIHVSTQGVVTAVVADGYFLQTLPGQEDGDPATSEGIFVHTGTADPAILVGQHRRVEGHVEEVLAGGSPHQLTLTRLADTRSLLLASGLALPAPIALKAEELSPDADVDTLERYEGMRVSVAALVVVGPAGGRIDQTTLTAVSDGVIHAVWGQTLGIDASLPFRRPGLSMLTAGMLPAGKELPMHDGNPGVLRVDSRAQAGAPLLDLGWNDRLRDAVGVLGYEGARYSLLVDPVSTLVVEPRPRGQAGGIRAPAELRMAWADLGELFDASDDPTRDEPVPSLAGYHARLGKVAGSICRFMDNPEIMAVSGAENLQVLRDLATVIETNPAVVCPEPRQYQALLLEGQHPSGLNIGFLVAGAVIDGFNPRVQVLEVTTFGASETSAHPAGGFEPLFASLPMVARLRITSEYGHQFDFTAVNVRFRELDGSDSLDPDSGGWATRGERIVTMRARQAASLALWLEARQQANPNEAIAVLGGFDADTFNDGRVDVMGIVTGRAAPANESWVSLPSALTSPLTNLTQLDHPWERYNASERGEFRGLDHILVNHAMQRAVAFVPSAPRLNADFPRAQHIAFRDGNPAFSSRDPRLARMAVKSFIETDISVELLFPSTVNPNSPSTLGLVVANRGPSFAPAVDLEVLSTLVQAGWSLGAQASGWICSETEADAIGSRATCRHAGLANGEYNEFGIFLNPDETLNGTGATFVATVTGGHVDLEPANNRADAMVDFTSDVDVYVELSPIGGPGDVPPGSSGGWTVVVNRTPLNPAGLVEVTIDIEAALGEVTLDLGTSDMACGPGIPTGARNTRFACTIPSTDALELAKFDVSFSTRPDDGGRLVVLTVEANSEYTDVMLNNNVASDAREVRGAVDLVAVPAEEYPHGRTANITTESTMRFGVYNNVDSVASNARAQIEVALPPAAIHAVEPHVYGDHPNVWTCAAPKAFGSGSRILCEAPPLLGQPGSDFRTYYFLVRYMAPFRPGEATYLIETSIVVSADEDDHNPLDNVAQSSVQVDQMTDLIVRAPATDGAVVEPAVATYPLSFEAEGGNPPRNPRVNIAFDHVFPTTDIAVTNAQGEPVACAAGTAPAGGTAVLCPVSLASPDLFASVVTNPTMTIWPLVMEATVTNDLVDRDSSNNRLQRSIRVLINSDMCVGTSCSPAPRPYPLVLKPNTENVLVYDVANLGPSTSRAQILTVSVALPRERVSASFDGQACRSSQDMGDNSSYVTCVLPDFLGDGAVRQVSVKIDTTGLLTGDVAVGLIVQGGGNDSFTDNNRLDFVLPIAAVNEVDLWTTVSSKPSTYPLPVEFLVTLGADGSFHTYISRVIVEVDMPFPSGSVGVAGNGWYCAALFGSPSDPRSMQCNRLWPMASGTVSYLAVTVPANDFKMTGREIRVTARHFFPPGATVVDNSPSNDIASATWLVKGRRTQSSIAPAEPTPAHGVRRTFAPTPLRPKSRAASLD